jgi:hypothetical protein
VIRSLICLAVSASAAFAQGGKPLKTGDAIPGPFRMFVVSDARFEKDSPNLRTNRIHCFVCEAELNPTIAVFARTPPAADVPGLKIAKALHPLVGEFKAERLGAFVAFLSLGKEFQLEDGREAKAKALADLATQNDAKNVPIGLAAGKSEATDLYGLGEGDDVTIIFFDRQKVLNVWTFAADKAPDEAKLKELADTVRKHLKK